MTKNAEQQLRAWVQKQKTLINEAPDEKQRDYIAMMWLGFLNGLRMSKAITYQEYQEYYSEIQRFIAGLEAA